LAIPQTVKRLVGLRNSVITLNNIQEIKGIIGDFGKKPLRSGGREKARYPQGLD
jgi:hypothetical protein